MQITVIDVGTPNTHTAKNGRSYQSMEVTYKSDNGQVSSKKLMSFSNPDVFNQAKSWEKGTAVNINAQKDDNGYWQWVGILADGEVSNAIASSSTSSSSPKQATRITGSNYETKEERQDRQVMIVRQSSLSNAVATLTTHGTKLSANDVISLAKTYEAWVLGKGAVDLDDMEDDIPV
jgi:hypothetical protein